MTCPKCGTENAAGNRFCMKCGADMTAATPVEASSAGATGSGSGYTPTPTPQPAMSGDPPRGTQERYGAAGYAPDSNGYTAAPQFAPNPASYGAGPNAGMINQGQLAGLGGRLLAYIIDALIIFAAAIVVVIIAAILNAIHLGAVGVLLFIALYIGAIVYQPYCWVARAGQTIGHQAMHMRVVKLDGGPITIGTAIVRFIGFIVDSIIFGLPIGLLWCLWDAKKQCWHDKIANTVVVQA